MMNKKQTAYIVALFMVFMGFILVFCIGSRERRRQMASATQPPSGTEGRQDEGSSGEDTEYLDGDDISVIHAQGRTLKTRCSEPEGYQRTKAKKNSFTAFLRNYKLKKAGSPVRCYNGKKKSSQSAHVAVFCLPIEKEDLQQCADSVMRMYAEYYWHMGQYDKIAFHFVDGFLAEYGKWRRGYRIQVSDTGSSWVHSAGRDDSYQCFQAYMRIVFSYASTLSMERESKKIKVQDIRPGDLFLEGGSPGHVVMVVDVCKNAQGKKAFLLAQGYMPAQEFHLLKNPLHENDPWYYEEEVSWPFFTPEYTFEKGSLVRPEY